MTRYFDLARKRVTEDDTPLNGAIRYGLDEMSHYFLIFDDGRVSMTSNIAEQTCRQIKMLKNNMMFSVRGRGLGRVDYGVESLEAFLPQRVNVFLDKVLREALVFLSGEAGDFNAPGKGFFDDEPGNSSVASDDGDFHVSFSLSFWTSSVSKMGMMRVRTHNIVG